MVIFFYIKQKNKNEDETELISKKFTKTIRYIEGKEPIKSFPMEIS